MTAQRDADIDIDIESLRKSARRPLDTFLIVSIVFLFMVVAAVVAVIILMVKQPQVIAVPQNTYKVSKVPLRQKLRIIAFSDLGLNRFSFIRFEQMDDFVYLEATSSKSALILEFSIR